MKTPYCIKICTKCRRILVACEKNFSKMKNGKWKLNSICKRCNKRYREEHKEKIAKYKKKYYQEHKEERNEYKRQHRKNNPHIYFNSSNKRRKLKENQGRGITKEQWFEMMNFFDWKCAYSDVYIGGESKHRTIDHIVPLSQEGENEPWNCVPCFDKYNYEKYDKELINWYIKQTFYSESRLEKIYKWQEYAKRKWGGE